MGFDTSLLTDELFVRVQTMQLTHLGFHIHPERLFILADCREIKDEAYIKQIVEIGNRYFEIDICVLTSEGDKVVEDDNIYTIEDVETEKEMLLASKATAILTTDTELLSLAKELLKPIYEPASSFIAPIAEHLQKMGINREGTSSLAIGIDDTTQKIKYGCDTDA